MNLLQQHEGMLEVIKAVHELNRVVYPDVEIYLSEIIRNLEQEISLLKDIETIEPKNENKETKITEPNK